MLVQWLDQYNIPQVTKYCYSDTYGSLTHNTKLAYLLVLMQLHLNPSFKCIRVLALVLNQAIVGTLDNNKSDITLISSL